MNWFDIYLYFTKKWNYFSYSFDVEPILKGFFGKSDFLLKWFKILFALLMIFAKL